VDFSPPISQQVFDLRARQGVSQFAPKSADSGSTAIAAKHNKQATYVGRYRVTVPAGTYPAALIKWQYHGEVGLAGFKGSQYWFFADGLGPIAVIDQQHISALLFYKKDTKYGKVIEGKLD
jgi:hypothetical protein